MSRPHKKQPSPALVQPAPPAVPDPEPIAPCVDDPKDEEYRRALYMEHQKQAWSDCQSGSDEFDKSILTYSSAGLGVSLVFIKDIVPLAKAVMLWLLYASWIAFGVAILVTVFSFQLSVAAQELHLDHLRKYYLEKKLEFLNAPNIFGKWVGRLKWVSGACFILAMAGTIVFSILNLTEAKHMSENKGSPANFQEGRKPMSMTPNNKVLARDGRTPMAMTSADLGKGRGVGTMTPVPPVPQAPQNAPAAAPPAKK